MDLNNATREQFSAHVGSSFWLGTGANNAPGSELELQLDEVSPAASIQSGRERFALLFSAPQSPKVSQGTHTLRHSALGELAIFLVPVMSDPKDGALHYEAIFG